jgi:adenylosuccinate lyase
MTEDRYRSRRRRYLARDAAPLGERYRIRLWRRTWLALAETEQELGRDPGRSTHPDACPSDDADLNAGQSTRSARHDVMAHVHHFGDQAPAAKPFLHLGAAAPT